MNLVADESVEIQIVHRLRADEHDCFSIQEQLPGTGDDRVLELATAAHRVLLTSDTDFGELVFRLQHASAGVVLLRLAGLSNELKADIASDAIRKHVDELSDIFMVVEPGRVRTRLRRE
jgi:predicted nuclease of predicted toxin-antitoxin system